MLEVDEKSNEVTSEIVDQGQASEIENNVESTVVDIKDVDSENISENQTENIENQEQQNPDDESLVVEDENKS